MRNSFFALMKKDFRLMLSAKFFLLAAGSLILYSCYIHFVYVNLDDELFPVYCYDLEHMQDSGTGRDGTSIHDSGPSRVSTGIHSSGPSRDDTSLPDNGSALDDSPLRAVGASLPNLIYVSTMDELQESCADGYSVGIDLSGETPRIHMVSCGMDTLDNLRAAYAVFRMESEDTRPAACIGNDGKEMKNRREITAEFLFFELAAVGFLGLAAMLFKEKEMGVIRIHAVLPVQSSAFILSKLDLILLADLTFTALLTLISLGPAEGLAVLPAVLLHAGILSLIMALVGFLCAVALPDFKQFSLLYLVLAIFITTPVFMAGQMGIEFGWMKFHPMYHLFMAMKHAYFRRPTVSIFYYAACASAVFLLFFLAKWTLALEMKREG
nr:ABC transporter permease [uncultured Schaedlerella sp.]